MRWLSEQGKASQLETGAVTDEDQFERQNSSQDQRRHEARKEWTWGLGAGVGGLFLDMDGLGAMSANADYRARGRAPALRNRGFGWQRKQQMAGEGAKAGRRAGGRRVEMEGG